MARVKTAMITRRRHKKVLKQAKGYFGAKHYRFRNANQAVLKSLSYSYVGRKDKKSNFRKLWIARFAKSDDDVNIMTLGADCLETDDAIRIMRIWIATEFKGGRYKERTDMIKEIENENMK